MKLTILRAGLEHLDQIAPLFDAYRVFYEQASDLDGAREFLRQRLERCESVVYLAMRSGGEEPVGFTQLFPSFSSTAMRRIWILNDLFVAPEARQEGVGRALMEAAREMAAADGAARLTLATARNNHRAKALYNAQGYRIDEVFDHYNLQLE